jgi:6,7-dimethyl-8-ribityllumazine synthase
MPRIIEGMLVDSGGHYAIVVARFNHLITDQLLAGCLDALRRHGVDIDTRVDVVKVPGAVELPLACMRAAKTGRYAAVIAIGAVIRGATPHFEHVAGTAASGVAHASMATDVPIVFGVLTTDTIEQALERAGTKAGNNGFSAGVTALEMVSVFQALEG